LGEWRGLCWKSRISKGISNSFKFN
jgi:hypothetical protein